MAGQQKARKKRKAGGGEGPDVSGGKLWGGRFAKPTRRLAQEFVSSLPYDAALAFHDVAGSRAHARMLMRQGILGAEEGEAVLGALDRVHEELAAGSFVWRSSDEDIHTAVERRSTELIGPVAGKLHTARSRNDQVALDLRLYCKAQAKALAADTCSLARVLLEQAEKNGGSIMPGYTHMQRAQPVLVAHHLCAHVAGLLRDVKRFQAAYEVADVMPLGAAALAGTSFPVDPAYVAAELGFARVATNAMDAVSDRDFAFDLCAACASTMLHVSRLAEELVLFSSGEFSFLVLDDAYATGSSIMPQKKNPDVAELARAKAGRVAGGLAAFMAILKGLPLAYDADLQEAKEVLIDVVGLTAETLAPLVGMVSTLTWRPARMLAAAEGGFATATELADYLAGKGVPFRQAHEIVGRVVAACEARGCVLGDLSLAELKEFSPLFGQDALELLDAEGAVARKRSPGGTAPERVAEQIEELSSALRDAEAWAGSGTEIAAPTAASTPASTLAPAPEGEGEPPG